MSEKYKKHNLKQSLIIERWWFERQFLNRMFFNHRICNWKMTKMALKVKEKDIVETEDIPIVVVTSIDIISNIKGYHVYKNVWTPTLQEQVYGEIEPHNPVDKYAVAVKKDEKVIGHLPLGENGKFAKTIFYFLRADPYVKCNKTVVGKAVNLGDGDGMQVPCILH